MKKSFTARSLLLSSSPDWARGWWSFILLFAMAASYAGAFVVTNVATRARSAVAGKAPPFAKALLAHRDSGVVTGNAAAAAGIFPPPLSPVDRVKRAATFWVSVVPIVAQYYGLMSKIKFQEALPGLPKPTEEEVDELWKAQHRQGATKLAGAIGALQGFYVKTAQIIAARQDLFPEEYTEALRGFTDGVDPMPAGLARAVVEAELLRPLGESFDDVFAEFDEEPIGAASVAQVHRAVLTEKYGGKEVAVKVQRPSVEPQLLGDVANLMTMASAFRGNPNLPLDYYTVFSELEKQLAREFDFIAEADAMDRVYESLVRDPDTGKPRESPVVVPRPVPELVCRRVLVMDFLRGVPLSRAAEEMARRGVDPNSPQAKLFGRKLVSALTTVFGRTILETGFFHADPHPGNIFLLEDGQIGLIDFGQVKQITDDDRETLNHLMIALAERRHDNDEDLKLVSRLAEDLGIVVRDSVQDESKDAAAASIAMWLFDGSSDAEAGPGGFDHGNELSANSPIKALETFPEDLVLVARSSVLIKALSRRFDVPWSLAKEWAPTARRVLSGGEGAGAGSEGEARFLRRVARNVKTWTARRAGKVARRLPTPMRNRAARVAVWVHDHSHRHNHNHNNGRHQQLTGNLVAAHTSLN